MILAQWARLGAAQVQGQARGLGEAGQLRFHAGNAVPVARDQELHRELPAQGQHAAVVDTGPAVGDGADQVVGESGTVFAYGRNGQELLHYGEVRMERPLV